MNKTNKHTKTHRHRQPTIRLPEGKGDGEKVLKGKRVKYMVTHGDLNLGTKHRLQYTDDLV